MKPMTLILSLFFLCPSLALAQAQVPTTAADHFHNAPENLNTDPAFVPGEFPLGDIYAAHTAYYAKKAELSQAVAADSASYAVTLGTGEVSFTVAKNETASVLGYFREYLGALKLGPNGPERLDMVLDVNSLDTGVPGRNNRILSLFFQSMKPDLGLVTIAFDHFELGGAFADWKAGETREVTASGMITLNGVQKPLAAKLSVTRSGQGWSVTSAEPVTLLISDFNFADRVYELMKSCNHKAIGNAVAVKVNLELR
ncbi:MAG TPA: YceI family protein [Verrucomicrobiae bacterium]|jgi:polyisoprenoid-binding protein YceI|nr:YceI family protein [Verrucomicrobiae bacterium]